MGDEGETGRVDSGERFQVMPKKKQKKKQRTLVAGGLLVEPGHRKG